MRFLLENFRMGLKNLRLHKMRSLLTALGIIFGVLAVIVMVAIGEGSKREALRQMEKLGPRNLVIKSIPPPESNEAGGGRTTRVADYGIRRTDLERIRTLNGVTAIVPVRESGRDIVVGTNRFSGLKGIAAEPLLFDVINLTPERGEVFTQRHFDEEAAVCVLGAEAARQMFPFEDPMGKTVQIGTPSFGTLVLRVIGVLQRTGLRKGADKAAIIDRDIDSDVYFPLSLSRRAFGDSITIRKPGGMERKNIELSEVWLQADSINDVEALAKRVEYVLGIGWPRGQRPDANVTAPISILRAAEAQSRIFNFIMVGIASFALIVGGIGIMNIMLATVTERTREIGIRRALGAKRSHITLQFLIETTVISLSGGLIGIGLGMFFAYSLPAIVQWFGGGDYPTAITSWSVIGSFVVSGLIGISFGLYPAIQAARMNPIEALRHE